MYLGQAYTSLFKIYFHFNQPKYVEEYLGDNMKYIIWSLNRDHW